ncbi:MAG: aminotransferase class I/II-fold pyridoxal phosphate-dependent enzyme [Pseudomonadota bacterium]
MAERFTGNFTQQEPIPEDGIEAALAVLRHGRLHRYNVTPGEVAEAALLEQEFAASVGAKYCLAVTSGGYAMATALRATGVAAGDAILSNAFTLAPVPGAIAAVGARPVFVEVTEALTLDLEDLEQKAAETGARTLLLSHMRGHMCDMDRLMAFCDRAGITVIEDCAHTMGAAWDGVPSGRHGLVGCYSTQTYKHINSGEGGFITSDDPDVMARAIMLSGSYMLYERHLASPPADAFAKLRYETPNMSGRMDNLRAAILRAQLPHLPDQVARWNRRYRAIEAGLADVPGIQIIARDPREHYVGSSIQFLLPGWGPDTVTAYIARLAAAGVEVKWFGAPEPAAFTSRYSSWHFTEPVTLPRTDAILAGLIDMRVPLTLSLDDCALIARILAREALEPAD